MPVYTTCLVCGATCKAVPSKPKKFCSKQCQGVASRDRVQKPCERCDTPMELTPFRASMTRFCSRSCGNGRTGSSNPRWAGGMIDTTCAWCSEPMTVRRAGDRTQRFCDRKCADRWRSTELRGAASARWNGGDVELVCEWCGDSFWRSKAKADRKYCSNQCNGSATQKMQPRVSSLETAVAAELDSRGIEYEQQAKCGRYVMDFRIGNVIVECDGAYWHSRPGVKDRDSRKDAACKKRGWSVVRLTEDEIRTDVVAAVDRVGAVLGSTGQA